MTNKEYMSRPFYLQNLIEMEKKRLSYLENAVRKADPVLSEMPKGSPDPQKFEKKMIELIALKQDLADNEEKLKTSRQEVSDAISRIPDQKLVNILQMRYLLYMCWEDIMAQNSYCRSYVYQLHGKALRMVEQKT